MAHVLNRFGPRVAVSCEDLIHQHVLYVLRKNPDVARTGTIRVPIQTAMAGKLWKSPNCIQLSQPHIGDSTLGISRKYL